MVFTIPTVLSVLALSLFVFAMGYMIVATGRVLVFRQKTRHPVSSSNNLPVTVLKPICGMEFELAENLRSFCRQEYAEHQVIFGVREKTDPAIPVIEAVIKEFPDRDISLVVDDQIIGSNYKISNLANMAKTAKHGIFVISDSDMRVSPDYLQRVTAPFGDSKVGATTCLYSGTAAKGLASRLGAMFVNDWFLPSALIPTMFGKLKFCFGATMAVRRNVLEDFGGFPALADFLADDYMLGKFVVDQGYDVALVPYIVENVILEEDLKGVFFHEIRWARTIRSVQPGGYAASITTEIFPLSIFAAFGAFTLGASISMSLMPVTIALGMRTILHYAVCRGLTNGKSCGAWLIPVRDMLSFAVRIYSFCGTKVLWREREFVVLADNRLKVAK
ncbi:MAG: glycosyltransferase [Alphaproteobacteria bacterium]|nr:glycosyltransferase [Alphaproteobacteria bacterium]